MYRYDTEMRMTQFRVTKSDEILFNNANTVMLFISSNTYYYM